MPDADDPAWRPERAWAIRDALGGLLDDLEARLDRPDPVALPPDPLPLSTGFVELDRVCGGGVHPGWVTVVEADQAAQARALLYSVARLVDHRSLLDVASAPSATAWLLSAASEVPAAVMRSGVMSDEDWGDLAASIGRLVKRPLTISDVTSTRALARLGDRVGPALLLVENLARLGLPEATLSALAEQAARHQVAVLATAGPLGEVPRWALDRVSRVSMLPHDLGGRATLVRVDETEAMAVGHLWVDALSARVTEGAHR